MTEVRYEDDGDPSDDVFIPPSTITIVGPLRMYRPRGLQAGKKSDAPYAVRYSADEIASIREAATLLRMPVSDFLRWVGFFTSQEIIRLHTVWERDRKRRR